MPGRPFSTHQSNPDKVNALHDGVPSWMRSSVNDWLRLQLHERNYSEHYADSDRIRRLERLLRKDLSNGEDEALRLMEIIFYKMSKDEMLKLDVIDGLLQLNELPVRNGGALELEEILSESGSKWKVVQMGEDKFSLEERLTPP